MRNARAATSLDSVIVAVERGGNHKWVYRQAGFGGWERMTDLIGNLSRLAPRLRPHLWGEEVPPL